VGGRKGGDDNGEGTSEEDRPISISSDDTEEAAVSPVSSKGAALSTKRGADAFAGGASASGGRRAPKKREWVEEHQGAHAVKKPQGGHTSEEAQPQALKEGC